MPKLKYVAYDATGTKHTRTSERTYTHTVVYLPSYDRAVASAKGAGWTKSDASNFAYYAQIAAGNDPHPRRCYMAEHPDKWSAEEIAKSQEHVAAENTKRFTDAVARTVGHTRETYVAAQLAERLASVEREKANGHFETWRNAGWCGRRDLAEKLAGKTREFAAKVEILEPITND